jgi:predicted GTPase
MDQVVEEQALEICAQFGVELYVEVSASNGENVDEMLAAIAELCEQVSSSRHSLT